MSVNKCVQPLTAYSSGIDFRLQNMTLETYKDDPRPVRVKIFIEVVDHYILWVFK